MSPALRTFDLGFTVLGAEEDRLRSSHVASSFLQNLPLLAPNLEALVVRGDFNIYLRSLQSIDHFTRLERLSTPPTLALDEHTLRVLSSIATLHDLSCWIDLSGTSAPAFGQDAFHQLTSLAIRGASDHIFAFMRACQLSSLGHIDLRITQPPSSRHPRDLFAALCQHCEPPLLTALDITFSHDFVSRPNSLMEYFEPLLALPHTTSFHVVFSSIEPSIRDDDLSRFGAAWPLARFHVEHRTRQYAQRHLVRPTLSGIITLARLCPFLTTLYIPELDPRAIPNASTGAVPALGHGLRVASIMNIFSPLSMEVYLEVAGVLDRVFPALDLDAALKECMGWGKGWGEVLSFLKAMRVGRVNGGAYADLLREGWR
ncbi:hypothetical protein GSI_05586 [Ganoderma sinense ZZ0214-1]|uniref:Uncharacterized protein n=1 Tax=Ganoderma sinense ZZ0214-1 TaxID=1077348 RepID=A0A2G8SEZ9_9APHY|nr:hypothetical protein GSI_05586 [Ganoderma sinense ZZ0214-1]